MAHKFKRTLDGSAPVTEYIPIKVSTTITKGDLCALSSGYLCAAADGGSHAIGVAEATVDNSTGAKGALTAPVNVNLQSVYEGTLDCSSAQDYYGVRCEVDSATVIDPSDTSDPIVMCLGPVGTASDKKQEFVILDYSGIA